MCARIARASAAALAALGLVACSFSHMNRDRSTRPDTAVGTRAKILLPGEPAPPMSGGSAPAASSSSSSSSQSGGRSSGQTTQSGTEPERSTTDDDDDDDMTMIGGSTGSGDASTRDRETPFIGPLLTLFGYPFWINEQH